MLRLRKEGLMAARDLGALSSCKAAHSAPTRRGRAALARGCALFALSLSAMQPAWSQAQEVDLALVLAVDISGSMDPDEQ